MQFKSTLLIAVLLSASACKNSEPAPKPTPVDQSAQAKIYVQIRELAAQGNLSAASKLTDDPPGYLAQIETARLRMDEAAFLAGMQQAADNPNIEALRVSGDYSMLVTQYDSQGTMQLARRHSFASQKILTARLSSPMKIFPASWFVISTNFRRKERRSEKLHGRKKADLVWFANRRWLFGAGLSHFALLAANPVY